MRLAGSKGIILSVEPKKLYTPLYKHLPNLLEIIMTWTTPAAIDLRFGFEITMYIANR
jgi:pyrroloquinoline quinone biosynthesis protein A